MAVWVATTVTGMVISWAGVGDAMRGTTLAGPDLAAEVPVRQGRPPGPAPSSGASAEPAPSPSPSPSSPRPGSGGTSTAAGGGRSASPKPSKAPGETVRTYTVKSGRVVLALSDDEARLVSATPDNGFRAKVWRQSKWLRVDLTDDVHGSAVFAKWNGHPPIIQVYEY